MTKLSVEKLAEVAKLSLDKVGLTNPPPLRVCVPIDVSGSMAGMFNSGIVQGAFDQLLGAAFKLDDNGEIDTWAFDNSSSYTGTAKPGDIGTFIKAKFLPTAKHLWGGTEYAPPIRLVQEQMFGTGASAPAQKTGGMLGGIFGRKPAESKTVASQEPVLAFLLTDGENSDPAAANAALQASAGLPIYWNMVGIGSAGFNFLQRVADDYDNVGFIRLQQLNMTPEQMYESLFTEEFASWVNHL